MPGVFLIPNLLSAIRNLQSAISIRNRLFTLHAHTLCKCPLFAFNWLLMENVYCSNHCAVKKKFIKCGQPNQYKFFIMESIYWILPSVHNIQHSNYRPLNQYETKNPWEKQWKNQIKIEIQCVEHIIAKNRIWIENSWITRTKTS